MPVRAGRRRQQAGDLGRPQLMLIVSSLRSPSAAA
jgi:hypothetical protein